MKFALRFVLGMVGTIIVISTNLFAAEVFYGKDYKDRDCSFQYEITDTGIGYFNLNSSATAFEDRSGFLPFRNSDKIFSVWAHGNESFDAVLNAFLNERTVESIKTCLKLGGIEPRSKQSTNDHLTACYLPYFHFAQYSGITFFINANEALSEKILGVSYPNDSFWGALDPAYCILRQ